MVFVRDIECKTFESVDEIHFRVYRCNLDVILKRDHSNIATKQYFSEVPFVFRYFLK